MPYFRVVHLSNIFVDKVAKCFMKQPYERVPAFGEVFRHWREQQPAELEQIASSVDVNLEDLLAGDPVCAMKVLTENKEPWSIVADVICDPLFQARLANVKFVSPETQEAFEDAGLKRIIDDVYSIDVYTSTTDLVNAVGSVMRLYGFVEVENFWRASFGSNVPVPVDFKQITGTPLVLPFDDYILRLKFVRGFDEMELNIHHRDIEQVREGTYVARTLLGNTRIVDLPVLSELEVRIRYANASLDPLTMAFKDGFIVKNERLFAYHPRVLLECLGSKLGKPEHRYFFLRQTAGHQDKLPRPDYDELSLKIDIDTLKVQTGQAIPSRDRYPVESFQEVMLDFSCGKVAVDTSMFSHVLNCENFKRLRGIMSLGNLNQLYGIYANQSRLEHSIGVFHVANVMCNRFGIKDKDRLLVLAYALTHDYGTLTGSHATEDYFRAKCGFDHERFAVDLLRKDKSALEDVVDVEELVDLFEHRNPLHLIVDGAFGADRIYYLMIDPHECGFEKDFNSFDVLNWLAWTGREVVVDQNPEKAFDFLDFRARQYEALYYSPQTQIADAYQKKMLFMGGINTPFDKVRIENNGSLDFVPEEGLELEFWRFTDTMFQYTMCHHSSPDAREVMRHLLCIYHKSPHGTVAVLKNKGFETESEVEIPVYSLLVYGKIAPLVEGVDPDVLSSYYEAWKIPEIQNSLESEISKRSGIPARHIIVAGVPSLKKLSSEYAPVRVNHDVKSLFDWNSDYAKSFSDRANHMACLRVAVHPQIYALARAFFEENSFEKIVKEVLKK